MDSAAVRAMGGLAGGTLAAQDGRALAQIGGKPG
jgi:hypothetical protein